MTGDYSEIPSKKPRRMQACSALALAGVILASALCIFVWRAYRHFRVSHEPSLLLLLVAETLTVMLVLIARPPAQQDKRP